jgi:hypothetical protein
MTEIVNTSEDVMGDDIEDSDGVFVEVGNVYDMDFGGTGTGI